MKKKIGIIILAACAILAIPVLAQTVVKWYAEQKTYVEKTPKAQQKDVQWTLENWDADDADYSAARKDIDALRGNSELKAKVLLYEGLAKVQPNNALAQFKWAYSTWVTLDKYDSPEDMATVMNAPIQAMLNAPFPHTYDYARLLVLYQSMYGAYFGAIHKHADVMASMYPDDEELQYAVARMLVQLPNPEYIKKYVPILQHLRQKYPTDYRYINALVGYYQSVVRQDFTNVSAIKDHVAIMQEALKYPNLPYEDRQYYSKVVEAGQQRIQELENKKKIKPTSNER